MIEIDKSRSLTGFPEEQGLYNPKDEKDACGFGFIANINNIAKHEIIHQALEIVHNLDHRGAVGADPLAGDGAGILIQIPNEFFSSEVKRSFLFFLNKLKAIVLKFFSLSFLIKSFKKYPTE